MNERIAFGAVGIGLLCAVGCGEDAGSESYGGGGWSDYGSAPSRPGSGGVEAGTLTAGTWDDNRNIQRFLGFRSEMIETADGLPPWTEDEHTAANARFAELPPPRSLLDVALVIDTTGSMYDEIAYLQEELRAISSTIESRYPGADQRWALIVYRDQGDEYVTRVFDFVADLDAFRTDLARQSAGGGGDFPEAPHAALADMNALQWRSGPDVARLAFWVADAPHHADRAEHLAEAVREAAGLDIHIYPVASSGIDRFTEMTMRGTAQLTGGRYLFLTNDSGVGGDHLEASVPCFFVTKLDVAMLRMVDIEMSGEYREPAAEEIIRTGGDPADGACQLGPDDTAYVF